MSALYCACGCCCAHCVKRTSCVSIRIVRSVSGHVSPVRYLKPVPLGSRSITRVHRYYGHLRLPTATASALAVQACREVRNVSRQRWDLLGYCLFSLSGSMRSAIPGGQAWLALYNSSPCPLLPAGVLKPSARSYAVISGLQPSRSALSVTIAPRLLSYLRIKHAVTSVPARLDTRRVASAYRGGIPSR